MCDKFCATCRYRKGSLCMHDKAVSSYTNRVTGKRTSHRLTCDIMRDLDTRCDWDGILWEPKEPKEPLKTRIIKWFKEQR